MDQVTAKGRFSIGPPLALQYFPEHVLVLASQLPPAFWQSASAFAAVTSPAKAETVKASPRSHSKYRNESFHDVFSLTLTTRASPENVVLKTFVPTAIGQARGVVSDLTQF